MTNHPDYDQLTATPSEAEYLAACYAKGLEKLDPVNRAHLNRAMSKMFDELDTADAETKVRFHMDVADRILELRQKALLMDRRGQMPPAYQKMVVNHLKHRVIHGTPVSPQ